VHKRSIQGALSRFDAVDVRQTNLLVGLWIDFVTQQAKQPRRDHQITKVDFGQLVEPLRMYRLPFETEAKEHLAVISTELAQRVGRNEGHRSTTERGPYRQYSECLATAMQGQHQAKQR